MQQGSLCLNCQLLHDPGEVWLRSWAELFLLFGVRSLPRGLLPTLLRLRW